MADFSKPANAPAHVKYMLGQSEPKIILPEMTWAPVVLHARTKTEIGSSDKTVVDPNFCTYQMHTDPQVAWVMGRSRGETLVRFHTPVGDLPDLQSLYLKVEVETSRRYAVRMDEPSLMVIGPDKDLRRYKFANVVEAKPAMTPKELFTAILDKMSTINGGTLRNLVFQSHGSAGALWIFGKDRLDKTLDMTNVEQFSRIRDKVDAIWMLGCVTCADPDYRSNVVANSRAYLVGADTANPQQKMVLGQNEIEFHLGSRPIVIDWSTRKPIFRGDFVGKTTTSAHAIGAQGLAGFRPA